MSLRNLHVLSATVIVLFAILHLSNHLAGLAGIERHIAFMDEARPFYRNTAIEGLLLTCVAWQIVSGLSFVIRGWKARHGWVAWAQALSGTYLAFFLLVHVGAVLFGRGVLHLDTNFYYAAAGLHVAPYQWFFAPYYFLAVLALFVHLGCAAYWALLSFPRVAQIVALAVPTPLGLSLALLIVLMMAGAFFPVHIPPAYLATYAPRAQPLPTASDQTVCRTATVDGIRVFYRDAGYPSSPTLVLLHGNPSSSFMFRDLIPQLAKHFHVIAPDYPGFGYSDTPAPETYAYTFDHLAQTIDQLLTQIGATSYILYMQDYGGPVGMRLATAHPDRIKGLIIQNANAYNEGLPSEWRTELEQQAQNAAQHPHVPKPSKHQPPSAFATNLKWTQQMYTRGALDPSSMSPDGYTLDAALLSRPGQDDIQDILGDDYYTNMLLYPTWQRWLHLHHPRTLIVWGRGDYIFGPIAAESYKRDLPLAKLVFYDGGHFVLEEHASEVAHEIIEMFSSVRSS